MFDELRALFSFLQRRSLSIDGLVFGINCRMTAIILLAGLVVVCSTQLIGKPIHCDCSGSKIEQEFLNTYCFINPTYIVYFPEDLKPKYLHDPRVNHTGIFPGVLPNGRLLFLHPDPLTQINIDYYQWIWIIYFIQALCFYFPHWLWKKIEGRRIRSLVSHADLLVDRDHCHSSEYVKLIRIANYVANSFGSNSRYMLGYYLCEWIAFVNLFVQIYVLDLIFNGRYRTYGIDALTMFINSTNEEKQPNGKWKRLNAINMIFPRMTKCEYRRYGPSGSSENIDSLCMLPMNVFNDKFFLFIWFWIFLLMALFLLTFLYRLVQMLLHRMRTQFLCDFLINSTNSDDSTVNDMRSMLSQLQMADWFFLNLVCV